MDFEKLRNGSFNGLDEVNLILSKALKSLDEAMSKSAINYRSKSSPPANQNYSAILRPVYTKDQLFARTFNKLSYSSMLADETLNNRETNESPTLTLEDEKNANEINRSSKVNDKSCGTTKIAWSGFGNWCENLEMDSSNNKSGKSAMRRKSDPSYLRRHGATSMLMNNSNYGVGYYGAGGLLTNTDLVKHAIASRSVTSVDLAASALLNGTLLGRKSSTGTAGSSTASVCGATYKDGRSNARRSSSFIQTTSTSRPGIPHLAQFSDSGFSSFSSCSYLPPPPPYRNRSVGRSGGSFDAAQRNDIFSTNIFNEIANSCNNDNAQTKEPETNNNNANQLNINYAQHQINPRIHRSLSDSKYKSNNNLLLTKPTVDGNSASRKASTGTISSLSVHSGSGNETNNHQRQQRSLTHGDSSGCASPRQPTPPSLLVTNNGLVSNPYPIKLPQNTNASTQTNDLINNHYTIQQVTPSDTNTNTPAIVLTRDKTDNDSHNARYSNPNSRLWTSQISLSLSPSMSTVSCPEYPEIEEQLHRLAMARDSLSLQVALLNEQVGVQKEKIQDLETLLDSRRNNYPYKILSEQSLAINECSKSELVNEISTLKNKYLSLKKEKMNAEHRLHLSQAEIKRLSQTVQNAGQNQIGVGIPEVNSGRFDTSTNSSTNAEIENLRLTVQRLMADNEQKVGIN